jgi:DNA helicase-2/ATP-dependent DNA helicase PcrA
MVLGEPPFLIANRLKAVLEKLNPPQREAVSTLSGPLLVLAGAGTGKTRVVTFRIANLIKHGTRPDRILAVTFTRKASGEMQERAQSLLGTKRKKGAAARPEISTFHALCVKILKRHIKRLGYPQQFSICDRGEQEGFARAALREIRVPDATLKPGDLLALVSRWKMQSISPAQAESHAESDREHLAAVAYRRYQHALKAAGLVDFDDLLLLTEQLFAKFPSVRRDEASRFDHVMIDEYQDTNQSQYQIVRGLAADHRNLCVVGDDDQSIYGWRGAEVSHILRFKHDWPDARVVRLENNYRSTRAIIEFANTLIRFNSERHDKQLIAARDDGPPPRILQFKDETEEANKIVKDIQRQLGMGRAASEFAVLFRTNEQPRAFETEFRTAGVPYVLVGGMSFFDRREVRDILSLLRLAGDPGHEPALLRVLNTPPRGIGDAARKAMVAHATAAGESLWSTMVNPTGVTLSEASLRGVMHFRQQIERWQQLAERMSLSDLIRHIVDDVQYARELERLYDDPSDRDTRMAAIEEVVNAAGSYEANRRPSGDARVRINDFLDDLLVSGRDESRDKEKDLSRNAVALMTLHSAKGLEFPRVYLVGMEEGILPHKRSLEAGESAIAEERRLCYVGVTRAQQELSLSLALTRRKWGKPRETHPSRFLYEMTGKADNPHAKPRRASSPPTRRARPT